MMVCGVEEPLQWNDQLDLGDEWVAAGSSAGAAYQLNRYSFVWLGAWTEADVRFSAIAARVSISFGGHASLVNVLCQEYVSKNESAARARLAESRLKRMAGSFRIRRGLTIAFDVVPDVASFVSMLRASPRFSTGSFCILGRTPSLSLLGAPAIAPSLARLAESRKFSPDNKFLTWLEIQRLSICYLRADDLGRSGIVLISPVKADLGELEKAGYTYKLFHRSQAREVWRMGTNLPHGG